MFLYASSFEVQPEKNNDNFLKYAYLVIKLMHMYKLVWYFLLLSNFCCNATLNKKFSNHQNLNFKQKLYMAKKVAVN